MPSAVPLVRVVRSGFEESVHLGHVAVCDADGRLIAAAGDPHRAVFARSSLKPLQAAVSLRRIGVELPDDLVAVMCASHNGEPEHVRAVRRLLRACGATESALRCPPDLPSRREDALRVVGPRRIFHNCSGKHAGMVSACVSAGWPAASYLDTEHPLQREIAGAVRRVAGRRPHVGVDGCGAPVFGVPLSSMATLFARLARPERLGVLGPFAERSMRAMRAHPFLVAGTRRTDTSLMSIVPDVVSKGGAEALHCAAILGPGLGVAIKVGDGGDRAAGPALVRTLQLLGALTEEQVAALGPVASRPVLGGGRPVGELTTGFRLRRARG
jgi:L-asparaginase II